MIPLWSSQEAAQASEGENSAPWEASGVSIDTRTLVRGDLFVALRGLHSDGHDHVEAAFQAGAAAALVSQPVSFTHAPGPLLRVKDTQKGLEALAHAARKRSDAKIVAVTGSVGKTGTKEALRHVLAQQGKTHASRASYNNHWGVPLSLARMPADTQFGIFEIGMNHPGEITPLSKMVKPDVAVITTVEAVHLAYFSNMEEIADAKAEIFDGLKTPGVAVLNHDNPYFERLASRASPARVITFGADTLADIHIKNIALHEKCSCVSVSVNGMDVLYKTGIPGRHVVMNTLAVLGVVEAFEADCALACMAFSGLRPLKGRGLRHRINDGRRRFLLIDESYNANPVSMRAALADFSGTVPRGRGRRIAVLGDMLELGENAENLHIALAPDVEAVPVDLLFSVGPLMHTLFQAVSPSIRGFHAHEPAGLQVHLCEEIRDGDVVMIKGSLGSRTGSLVEALLAMDQGSAKERA